MAEIIFDCPACKQAVQADSAWAGQEIQCPLCHAPMIVPGGATAAEPHHTGKGLVDVPKETKLSAGATQVARSTTGSGPVIRNFQKPKTKKQNPIVKYAVTIVVLVALGVGGWFGWPYLKPHLPFLNKGNETAANSPAAAGQGGDAAATAAAQPATPPPPKEAPMTPPTYTLDLSQAKITEGKVNGTINGTNFVPDLVRLDKIAGAYVLEFRQGTNASPDRGLRVYLRLTGTNTPAGQSWFAPALEGPISQVVKLWKTDPKYAAQQKAFTAGFTLKLELGQMTESNTISGKIFAALPDKEQSVIAGVFHTTPAAAITPGAAPQPVATPQVEMSPEMQKRYGTRR